MRGRRLRHSRGLALLLPFASLACSTLIGLGDLGKSDCVDCGSGGAAGLAMGGVLNTSGTAVTSSGMPGVGGVMSQGGSTAGTSLGGNNGTAGALIIPGGTMGFPVGGEGNEGIGGAAPDLQVCPGGPEPPAMWKEHWYEHSEQLTRVYYDDCIALYFDPDMPQGPKDWLVPFLDASWAYSLATYGKVGGDRLFVVVHQDKFHGGHSAVYGEEDHDFRNVIDMGSDDWVAGDYDLPAHLMGFIVEFAGAHTKLGSPKFEHYGNEGFPLIYKYDLYVALGLNETADAALNYFNTLSNDEPYAGTFWFRDWFYPLWRDHGHAKIFADYENLLQKYYPVDGDNWMPTANYGQYFHFMSGAAGQDLEPLARNAFQWHPDFDEEISSAKQDFSAITY